MQNTEKLRPNNKAGEGETFNNLGNAYQSLGDFCEVIKYHEHHLQITKGLGDKAGEGQAYGILGIAYLSLGDFHKTFSKHRVP